MYFLILESIFWETMNYDYNYDYNYNYDYEL